jgi:hypothetical protein
MCSIVYFHCSLCSTPIGEDVVQELETKLKVKLPIQLKSLLLLQNGNKQFGVESVDGILAGMSHRIARFASL